jgi:hypothetical protein
VASTVFMHVGVAKTGTTYLQRILWANRDALRVAGLLYPGKRSGEQFVASVDLRDLQAEKYEHLDVDGAWNRIAAEVRSYDGSAVISHETFARCSSAEVRRVQESLGDAQLHMVLTVRDLGRQIPAVWQETVKNRATSSYAEFLSDIFLHPDSGEYKFFWRPQDVPKVVRRWGRTIGMPNVTVVTVPAPGAPRDELWRRFAAAIDVPPVDISFPEATSNVSLGPAEAELLRHVNAVLPETFPWPRYSRAVKRHFAERKLAARETAGKITVPPQWHEAVLTRAGDMVEYLGGSGCRIVGDLTDLQPQLPDAEVFGPEDLTRDQLLEVAAEVIRDEVILRPGRRRRVDVPVGVPGGWLEWARGAAAEVRRRVRRGG